MKSIAALLMFSLLYLGATAQQQVKKSFADVTSIDVEGLFCDVTVDVIAGEKVEFEGEVSSSANSDKLKIEYKQTGTDLKVWVTAPNNWNNSLSGSLVFKVPRSTNMNVNNVSGDVVARGLAGSKLALKSVSGRVEASNIASNLKVETVSGSVTVNTTEGNLQVASVSGSVDVSQVGGSLQASTVSGHLDIKKVQGQTKASSVSGGLNVSAINNSLSVSTTSGSINIDNVNGDVDSQSTSGSIRMMAVKGSIKAKTVSGSINGENILLAGQSSFNTMSGSVHMILSNSPETLSFDLKSFSGRLNAKGIIGKEKLVVEKGKIWVRGETFSGAKAICSPIV